MQQGFIYELTGLFFFILSGAAVYGFALYLLKLQELKMLVDKILKKWGTFKKTYSANDRSIDVNCFFCNRRTKANFEIWQVAKS